MSDFLLSRESRRVGKPLRGIADGRTLLLRQDTQVPGRVVRVKLLEGSVSCVTS